MVHATGALVSSHQLGFKDKAAWVDAEQGIPSPSAGSQGEEKACHCWRASGWGWLGTGNAEKGREQQGRAKDPAQGP